MKIKITIMSLLLLMCFTAFAADYSQYWYAPYRYTNLSVTNRMYIPAKAEFTDSVEFDGVVILNGDITANQFFVDTLQLISGADSTTILATGISTDGTLNVGGLGAFVDSVTVGGTFDATGTATFGSNINITGYTLIDDSLRVNQQIKTTAKVISGGVDVISGADSTIISPNLISCDGDISAIGVMSADSITVTSSIYCTNTIQASDTISTTTTLTVGQNIELGKNSNINFAGGGAALTNFGGGGMSFSGGTAILNMYSTGDSLFIVVGTDTMKFVED